MDRGHPWIIGFIINSSHDMRGTIVEANIDALVGPTHHYSGLGVGNVASLEHRNALSSPKQAALEGLNKAWWVAQAGVPQYLLPPPQRPRLDLLQRYGFQGSLAQQALRAAVEDCSLLSAVSSSSFMWAANSCTVTPASDSADGKVHLTVSNLCSSLHRALEADERMRHFTQLFGEVSEQVVIHWPLPSVVPLRDEGAANHMRLYHPGSSKSIHVVHGDDPAGGAAPTRFMARHTLAASQALQRLHQLDSDCTFHLQQHPMAISAGVFHNDVIATSHQNLLIHHEMAFAESCLPSLQKLEDAFRSVAGCPLLRILVTEAELSLQDAVRSYLFNSQLICPERLPSGLSSIAANAKFGDGLPRMLLIAPLQCRQILSAERLIQSWIEDPANPVDQVAYVDLRQSMAGGGGPACLRLRLPIQEAMLSHLMPSCRLDEPLYHRLQEAINVHYPEQLSIHQLADWQLVEQAWSTAETICQILGFQP
jgi:succinylarginine dihydrolase